MKRVLSLLVLVGVVGSAATAALAVSPRKCTRKLADQVRSCTLTLVTMRTVQTAIEAWAIDHHRFPEARSMSELRSLVQPTYIRTLPETDAWGYELRYVPTPDGTAYLLVSSGSDKVFDEASWTTPGLLESSKEDAVVSSRGSNDREWVIQK